MSRYENSAINLPVLNKLDPRVLFVVILIAQTAFFAFFAYKTEGAWLRGDNVYYETPAWNFAEGRGLSISRNQWEDRYLTDLYYAAHPEKAGAEFIPSTTLPVGYSYFIGIIYSVFGRSHFAVIFANLLLLYAALGVMYIMARRVFGDDGFEFRAVLLMMLAFPLWAFWASVIISDTLHLALLMLFALLFFVEKPSLSRVALAGLMLGLAVVVRPYSVLLPAALFLGGLWFGRRFFTFKNAAIVTVFCGLTLGAWALRNYYEFGRPMLTSMGLGHGIWMNTQKNIFTDDMTEEEMARRMPPGVTDLHFHYDNQKLLAVAIERIKADPLRDVLVTLTSVPRLWISLGGANASIFGKIISIAVFGALFVLMLAGMYLSRRTQNPIVAGAIVVIIYYTAVFAHLNAEGRYIIPARFFSFLLIAIALAHLLKRFLPAVRAAQT